PLWLNSLRLRKRQSILCSFPVSSPLGDQKPTASLRRRGQSRENLVDWRIVVASAKDKGLVLIAGAVHEAPGSTILHGRPGRPDCFLTNLVVLVADNWFPKALQCIDPVRYLLDRRVIEVNQNEIDRFGDPLVDSTITHSGRRYRQIGVGLLGQADQFDLSLGAAEDFVVESWMGILISDLENNVGKTLLTDPVRRLNYRPSYGVCVLQVLVLTLVETTQNNSNPVLTTGLNDPAHPLQVFRTQTTVRVVGTVQCPLVTRHSTL